MTKKVTKKVTRKRNNKLRRQVMRTLSALTMILALAITAIPVENLGTVSASLSDTPSTMTSSDYDNYVKPNLYQNGSSGALFDISKTRYGKTESNVTNSVFNDYVETKTDGTLDYKGTPKKAQIISEDGVITDVADISLKGSNAVITNFLRSSVSSVTLERKMYYNYINFSSEEIDSILALIYDDSVEIQYGTKSTSFVIKYTDADPDDDDGELTLDEYDFTSYSKAEYYATNSGNTAASGKYKIKAASSIYPSLTSSSTAGIWDTLFGENGELIYLDEYSEYYNPRYQYNAAVESLIKGLDSNALDTKVLNISKEQATKLEQDIKNKKTEYEYDTRSKESSGKMKINATTLDITEHREFYYDTICRRGIYVGSSNTDDQIALENFKIVSVGDETSPSSYVFKWKTGSKNDAMREEIKSTIGENSYETVSKKIDDEGFLSEGYASIKGIYDRAFVGLNNINTLVIEGDEDSFKWIGNDAFYGCNLKSITIPNTVSVIGSRAFYNTGLSSFIVQNVKTKEVKVNFDLSGLTQLSILGAEAFYGTSVTYATMPDSLTIVGAGCFANCDSLTGIDFSNVKNNLVIEPFAFYNDLSLLGTGDSGDNLKFSDKYQVIIGTGAFAVEANTNAEKQDMENFIFPKKMATVSGKDNAEYKIDLSIDASKLKLQDYNDYIFYGRSNLQNVTLINNWGSNNYTLPEHTFGRCSGLKCVTLNHSSFNDDEGQNIKFDENCLYFEDVIGNEFYVQGPGYTTDSNYSNRKSNPSEVRKSVVKLKMHESSTDGSVNYVPYKYIDNPNDSTDIRIEVAIGTCGKANTGFYLANIIPSTDDKGYSVATIDNYSYNTYKYTDNDIKDAIANNPTSTLTVPATVGMYRVKSLKEKCFESVIGNVTTLNIEDGSLVTIGESALEGATSLEEVYIGNSVISIEANAFAGCESLQDVYFSDPAGSDKIYGDPAGDDFKIDVSAFKTNSKFLTFHGIIDTKYTPFKYAMNETSTKFTNLSNDRNICYKSPDNLTVLMDNESPHNPTLVDYPHLYEAQIWNLSKLSSLIVNNSNYSLLNNILQSLKDDTEDYLSKEEIEVLNTALVLNIPSGIKSIDTMSFFTSSKNAQNAAYVNDYVYDTDTKQYVDANILIDKRLDLSQRQATYSKTKLNVIYPIDELYSTISSVVDATNADKVISEGVPGLFSGLFVEEGLGLIGDKLSDDADLSTRANNTISTQSAATISTQSDTNSDFDYRDVDYVEENIWGNDHLTRISIGDSIEEFPNYVFDSCENLQKVTLGSGLTKIGNLPFRGCKKLVDVESNSLHYKCENGIVYYREDTTTGAFDTIVEVLESRGNAEIEGSAPRAINSTNDPALLDVTTILDGAFSNCTKITSVDLTDTSIDSIPDNCFKGDIALIEIKLPSTVRTVGTGAFADMINSSTSNGIPVTIYTYSNLTNIKDESISDTTDYEIYGVETFDDGTPSYIKKLANNNSNVNFHDNSSYTVTFKNSEYVGFYWVRDIGASGSISDADLLMAEKTATDLYCPDGYVFDRWIWFEKGSDDASEYKNNINEDRTLIAYFKPVAKAYSGEPVKVTIDGGYITYYLDYVTQALKATNNTTTSYIEIPSGSTLTVKAYSKDGQFNSSWTTGDDDVDKEQITFKVGNEVATFVVPDVDSGEITLTAEYLTGSTGSSSTDGTGSGSTDGTGDTTTGSTSGTTSGTVNGSTSTDSSTKYTVVVNYGSGSGSYAAGESVSISAYAPTSSSKVFSKWTSNNSSVGFSDSTSATTSFIMPAADVTITANYKTRSDDDDDDDDTVSKRPGTSTSTTTVSSTPSNSSATTTAATTTSSTTSSSTSTEDNGNKIVITKNGVSNTDVANVSVTGSSDNFVVKVSESDEANEMAKKALTNEYGSLDNISYFPMDISLYDSTGQNKISDTYGLNVTVTMPIPDVLIQYGGNARVATTDDGVLTQITPKFTTIDGIACISFVAPHFSPYVIYVDKSNLSAGLMYDATPSTGDPIHPKWFAALGMACISVVLFVASDGRKRRRYRTA